MRKTYLVLALALTGLTTFTSCKKDSSTTAPSSSAPTITPPSDADGALAAVQVISTQTVAGITIPINIGTAVAWFGTSSSYQDAGTVTCDGNTLTKNNNAYVYQPTQSKPTGIDFTSSTAWTVSGGSTVTAFNHTDNSSFPGIDDISGGTEVQTSGSYTLSATTGVTGDSVIFVVSGPKATVTRVGGPNSSQHTFTAAEMASVGTTSGMTGLIQIAPYRLNRQTINSKKYYFIKEACVSKFVTLK